MLKNTSQLRNRSSVVRKITKAQLALLLYSIHPNSFIPEMRLQNNASEITQNLGTHLESGQKKTRTTIVTHLRRFINRQTAASLRQYEVAKHNLKFKQIGVLQGEEQKSLFSQNKEVILTICNQKTRSKQITEVVLDTVISYYNSFLQKPR